MHDIINKDNFKSDILIEGWSQDIFGEGVSVEFINQWKISQSIGINFNVGYKTEGYVLGKQLDHSLNIGTGICFYN